MTENAITKSKTIPNLRFIYIGVPALALLAVALYAHIRLAHATEDYTGILGPLDRIFDLAFAAGLAGLAFCIGRRVCRALGTEFASLAEEIAFSIMMGTGVIGLSVLGLGLAGLLRWLPVAVLMALFIFVSRKEAARAWSMIREGVTAVTATKQRRIIAASFGFLLVILIVRTATPPHVYDEAIYHLSVPNLFVKQGRVYPVLDIWPGNSPLLIHMIYTVCLIAKSDIAAKLFSLIMGVVTSLALYGFCSRFLTRRVGAISMFGFFGSGMVVEVSVTTRIDVAFAGMLFLCTYAMMVYFETERRSWLWVSAILFGFSMGIKYPAAAWGAIIAGMFLIENLRRRKPLLEIIKYGLAFTIIAVAVALPWYAKNYVWFHNPVYPLLTGEVAEYSSEQVRYFNPEDKIRLDGHLNAVRNEIPDVVKTIEGSLAEAASFRVERHPLRFWEYFTKPELYNVAEPYLDPNYLFLLTPLLIFFPKRKWLIWLAVFSIAFYLIVAMTSWVGRYLLPIYPPLTVLAAYVLAQLSDKLQPRAPAARWLPIIALVITVGSTAFVSISLTQAMDGLSFITGNISRRQFMLVLFYYPSIDFVNRHLPKDARVMMLGAQMCYDVDRDYIADTSWDATEWRRLLIRNDSLEEVAQDMKRQGITHFFYSPGLFKFAAMTGREGGAGVGEGSKGHGIFKLISFLGRTKASSGQPDAIEPQPDYYIELRNWATLELFRRKFLEPIYADQSGYYIYRFK
ncbi:MAG: glycosyltransferase family 39 protein [Blastocatellia bacterium]|nr:glycosyltransferase family 39 protein [Blastocatellia bacterium]